MSQSSFTRSLFTSTLVTGVIFSATALPFAVMKSNVVDIKIQNQSVVSSELQYLAAPYLSIAGGVSVAVGIGVFGVLGWRNSSRKLSNTAATNDTLAKSLAAHQAELERIKFSETRLRTQDLGQFLQPESTWAAPANPRPNYSLERPSSKIEIVESDPIIPVHCIAPPSPSPVKLAHAMKPGVTAAFTQPGKAVATQPNEALEPSLEPIENLMTQIQQLSRQVEELRNHSSGHMAA